MSAGINSHQSQEQLIWERLKPRSVSLWKNIKEIFAQHLLNGKKQLKIHTLLEAMPLSLLSRRSPCLNLQ